MTLDLHALDELVGGHIEDWSGLPANTSVGSAGRMLGFEPDLEHDGLLGDPALPASFALGHSEHHAGGIRLWATSDHSVDFARREVLVVEARHPVGPGGEPVPQPNLGAPDARLPARLGLIEFEDGEFVFASRGIALRVNTENGMLLSVIGFPATTVEDYVARLRPLDRVPHPLTTGSRR